MRELTKTEKAAIGAGNAALMESRSPNSHVVETVVTRLSDAGLLQSPETATEHERLQKRVAELEHPDEDLTATWSQYLDTTGPGARLACTDSLGRDVWLELDADARQYLHEHLAPRKDPEGFGDEEDEPAYDDCPGCGLVEYGVHDDACKVAPVTAEDAPAAPELTVFRASHDAIVFGLYTSRDAAKAHCEAYLRREEPTAGLEWLADDDGAGDQDAVEELHLVSGLGVAPTGYVVTPLTVASCYDEEADE